MANKFSLTKGKPIFIIDLILIPAFVLVVYSGLELHVAGEGDNHSIWEYWANFHVIASIISLLGTWLHVKAHWGWYKGLVSKGFKRKSKVTFSISILYLILTVTGVILIFFISGPNSAIGLWHYKLGLLASVLIIIHTVQRFSILIKGLRLFK